ncbi:hypothetical protein HDK90DRAFT_473475 [Phyllosticta capitalensis]|uniref:Secreted protein n=1 Tax=Phyllosticta capitalensis TaxID=121624 RepID=A0ABR1Z3X0_9PEZI
MGWQAAPFTAALPLLVASRVRGARVRRLSKNPHCRRVLSARCGGCALAFLVHLTKRINGRRRRPDAAVGREPNHASASFLWRLYH